MASSPAQRLPSTATDVMKRVIDVLCSAVGLLVLAPFFVPVAVAVRLESHGPSFFRQMRVGRHGEPFSIFKFRTMRMVDDSSALQITSGCDERITRLGSFLRRTKLDELPQLINVLRGDMSLVGPRPEVPKYVALYPEIARERVLSVRPGITDPASIEFANESDLLAEADDVEACYVNEIMPKKLELYEQYVMHRSLWGDFVLVMKTLWRIVA